MSLSEAAKFCEKASAVRTCSSLRSSASSSTFVSAAVTSFLKHFRRKNNTNRCLLKTHNPFEFRFCHIFQENHYISTFTSFICSASAILFFKTSIRWFVLSLSACMQTRKATGFKYLNSHNIFLYYVQYCCCCCCLNRGCKRGRPTSESCSCLSF